MADDIIVGTGRMQKATWDPSQIDKSKEDKNITWLFIGLVIFCAIMIAFMWIIKRSFN